MEQKITSLVIDILHLYLHLHFTLTMAPNTRSGAEPPGDNELLGGEQLYKSGVWSKPGL
jgi:hypothetical protein